jgi:hypothetical protein
MSVPSHRAEVVTTSRPNLGRRGFLGLAAATTASLALGAGSAYADGGRPHRVLVFTRTNGYRHASIPDAIRTITELGAQHGFGVVATEDPGAFTPGHLAGFTAVVFANTVGNVLTPESRTAIEEYVTSGGGWAGVHAAADTEYDWPFYTELLSGGRFLCHPLVNQRGTIVRESADHPATAHLPERWRTIPEEFYSFRTSVRGTAEVLLSIDESSYLPDPNTSLLPSPNPPYTLSPWVSGRMGDHPMSWQRPIGSGLSWYTALGHHPTMYADANYRRHLLGGILTVSRHGQAHLPA